MNIKISKLRLSKILLQLSNTTFSKIKVEKQIATLKEFKNDFNNLTQLIEMNIIINYDINNNDKVKFIKPVNGRTVPRTPLILNNGAYYLKARTLNDVEQDIFYNNKKLINPKLVVNKIQNNKKINYNNTIIQDIALNDIREIQIDNINYIVK